MAEQTKMIFVEHLVTLKGVVAITGGLLDGGGQTLTGKPIKLFKGREDTERINITDKYGIFGFSRVDASEGDVMKVVFEGDTRYASTSEVLTIGAPGYYKEDVPLGVEGLFGKIDKKMWLAIVGAIALLIVVAVLMRR